MKTMSMIQRIALLGSVVGLSSLVGFTIDCAGSTTPSATAPPAPPPPAAAPVSTPTVQPTTGPSPVLGDGTRVDWWFVFKFNAHSFPGCAGAVDRSCPFGGAPEDKYAKSFGQQFVSASSAQPWLVKGGAGCLGDSTGDPVGATFAEVYTHALNYVVWNDDFKGDPIAAKSAPWGHAKGLVAWDKDGNGLVMQVTTPSWPGSGSSAAPRASDGNSLGCVNDNNVELSQHFFAVRLTEPDVVNVLHALSAANVPTDRSKAQLFRNETGPDEIKIAANQLGALTHGTAVFQAALSAGVTILAKPSDLNAPPWQVVSSTLGGPSFRVATLWENPKISDTTAGETIGCWDNAALTTPPGAVVNATTGAWDTTTFGLTGGAGTNYNHAKIGVSTSGAHPYAVFGDMNQQGSLNETERKCSSSQNGRGGTFYVLENQALHDAVFKLIGG